MRAVSLVVAVTVLVFGLNAPAEAAAGVESERSDLASKGSDGSATAESGRGMRRNELGSLRGVPAAQRAVLRAGSRGSGGLSAAKHAAAVAGLEGIWGTQAQTSPTK